MNAHQQLSIIIRNQAKLMSVPESVPEITAAILLFWSGRSEFMGSNHLSEQPVLRSLLLPLRHLGDRRRPPDYLDRKIVEFLHGLQVYIQVRAILIIHMDLVLLGGVAPPKLSFCACGQLFSRFAPH